MPIRIDDHEPQRLNILTPSLSYELTGGPLNIMRFAVHAAKAGINVRWINLDGNGITHEQLSIHLRNYEGLENFGSLVSTNVWHALDSQPIPTNSRDFFMGTFYWTASVASATQRLLKNPNIIYFIQDFETTFFPHGSDFVEVIETYDLPHFAIFSTPFLSNFFKVKQIGVYKHNQSMGDSRSFATLPAIKSFKLSRRFNRTKCNPNVKRRLVLFARSHATRNAFELTISALSEAIRLKIIDPFKWEFVGVGAMDSNPICDLGSIRDACVQMIKNIPEREYKKILENGDIGLSLTISPNPSFSAFDFAAAGMIVVTNSFDSRTQESFNEVSQNFVVAKPTLIGIVNGISQALVMIDNIENRLIGSKLNLPKSWNDEKCYGSPLFDKIKLWFKDYSVFPFEFEQIEYL